MEVGCVPARGARRKCCSLSPIGAGGLDSGGGHGWTWGVSCELRKSAYPKDAKWAVPDEVSRKTISKNCRDPQ